MWKKWMTHGVCHWVNRVSREKRIIAKDFSAHLSFCRTGGQKGGEGRTNQLNSVRQTPGSVWVQGTAPDWLCMRTLSSLNFSMACQDLHLLFSSPKHLGESSHLLEAGVGQKRTENVLASASQGEKSKAFWGLGCTLRGFSLPFRLTEWTQID